MFKKNLAFLLVLFSAIFIFNSAAIAQETEAVTASSVTGIALPTGAQRVLPGSIPATITEGFDKVIPTDGSVEKGDLELLVWTGADYKLVNAPGTVARVVNTLKAAGWKYSVESEKDGITVFSAMKEGAKRRLIIGYYGATKEGLVITWQELLRAGEGVGNVAQNQTENNPQSEETVETKTVENSDVGGSILGSWYDGYSSILIGYTPTYGPKSFTPGRSHYFKYTFHPNGTFEFTGLMQFNQYGCSTSYFQDKRGRYTINGSQVTLTLTKNFWRQHNSCAPSANKEINHKLDPEVYTYSVQRNKYGKEEVCLNSGDNKPCYERTQN